jgi:DEAD/DEAH box helicase domain-containing protein
VSLPELLDEWRQDSQFAQAVASWKTLPARPARLVDFPADVHPRLAEALARRGIARLYTHQRSAWQAVRAGKHIVVVTGTASGKTLCYNLPVLDTLLRNPEARALYLFPTKALAQDQADELRGLAGEVSSVKYQVSSDGKPAASHNAQLATRYSPSAKAPPDAGGAQLTSISNLPSLIATYDGDTPADRRPAIRAQARIVITNPDMLHTGVLPHHTRWMPFFEQLRYVIIDELHALRGVFGSHVANVMRRLQRIASFYGASPQFILASATIANPVELAERMIEQPVTLIDDDGAPRGAKHFIIYNPPVVNKDLGLRRSAVLESVRLGNQLLNHEAQTIIFARSRQTVELILSYLQQSRPLDRLGARSDEDGMAEPSTLRAYRGGYLPGVRREIERGLREGSVRGVVTTNALELGVDIGQMAASVMVGYPGTVAAAWQQAGRAGRTTATSLALLVASAAPIDQYLAHHPSWFFGRSPEHGLINPDNLIILVHHLRCAAFELPFQKNEAFGRIEGARVKEFLDFLSEEGVLHASGDKYFWMSEKYPAESVSLRSASPDTVVIQIGPPGRSSQSSSASSQNGSDGGAVSNLESAASDVPDEYEEPPTALGEVDLQSAYWMLHPQAIYLHEGQSYFVDALDTEQKVARAHRVSVDYYTEAKSEVTIELVEQFAQAETAGGAKAHGEVKVTSQVTGFRKIKLFTHENLGSGMVELPPTELLTNGYWLSVSEATVEKLRADGMWRSDANDYGPNWQEQRRRVRERDGYRCQNCGVREDGAEHHVHHKTPFKQFHNYLQANHPSNLTTLCPSCHRLAETAVRVRSSLAGLAFALGHLAPLFLMCDRRDLGVHSDPKSPLTDGHPAIVIYDQAPAGIGLSERLYELHDDLLARAYDLISACDCADGCPSCVGPASESGEGAKAQTVALVEGVHQRIVGAH